MLNLAPFQALTPWIRIRILVCIAILELKMEAVNAHGKLRVAHAPSQKKTAMATTAMWQESSSEENLDNFRQVVIFVSEMLMNKFTMEGGNVA